MQSLENDHHQCELEPAPHMPTGPAMLMHMIVPGAVMTEASHATAEAHTNTGAEAIINKPSKAIAEASQGMQGPNPAGPATMTVHPGRPAEDHHRHLPGAVARAPQASLQRPADQRMIEMSSRKTTLMIAYTLRVKPFTRFAAMLRQRIRASKQSKAAGRQ